MTETPGGDALDTMVDIQEGSGGWFLEFEGRRVELRPGEYTLGRSRGCGVVLRDPSVSRGHALLSVRGGAVTLQDLQSSNGTYVNGRRLDAEARLAAGDRVILGETELFLRRAEPGSDDGAGAPAAEPGLFCPSCGSPLPAGARACTSCGRALGSERVPRRSEALALGEVLPVGEVLGAPTGSWDETHFRRQVADGRSTAVTATMTAEATPAHSTAEMRVPPGAIREGERPSFRRRLTQAWRVLLGRDDLQEGPKA